MKNNERKNRMIESHRAEVVAKMAEIREYVKNNDNYYPYGSFKETEENIAKYAGTPSGYERLNDVYFTVLRWKYKAEYNK